MTRGNLIMKAGQFKISNAAGEPQRVAGVAGNSRQRRRIVRRWLAEGLQVKCLYVRSLPAASFKTAQG